MKTVLIVGANSDIAKATARQYAQNGYDLLLTARKKDQLNDFVKDLHIKYGCQTDVLLLDILKCELHQEFYTRIKQKITGVIIAVGYLGDQQIAEQQLEQTQVIINTNFTAVVCLLNIIANDFEKRGAGFIIAISSVAGDRGRKKNYIYGAAKAGLTAYLSGLRNRLYDKGITVLTVKPGFVYSKMTKELSLPKKLTSQPKDLAKAIYQAQQKGKDVLYYFRKWRLIMIIIKAIPEKIFKQLDL